MSKIQVPDTVQPLAGPAKGAAALAQSCTAPKGGVARVGSTAIPFTSTNALSVHGANGAMFSLVTIASIFKTLAFLPLAIAPVRNGAGAGGSGAAVTVSKRSALAVERNDRVGRR